MTAAEHISCAFTALVAEAVAQGDDLARPCVLADIEDHMFLMMTAAADKVRDRVLPSAQQVLF